MRLLSGEEGNQISPEKASNGKVHWELAVIWALVPGPSYPTDLISCLTVTRSLKLYEAGSSSVK